MGARVKLVDTDPSEVRRESDLSSASLVPTFSGTEMFCCFPLSPLVEAELGILSGHFLVRGEALFESEEVKRP